MRNEFTREQTLLQTLQVRYGGQFQKRYAHLSPDVMETVVRGAVMMLTDEQFNQGMARLYSSRYCPDIAEFQSWCVAGSWWTVCHRPDGLEAHLISGGIQSPVCHRPDGLEDEIVF